MIFYVIYNINVNVGALVLYVNIINIKLPQCEFILKLKILVSFNLETLQDDIKYFHKVSTKFPVRTQNRFYRIDHQ